MSGITEVTNQRNGEIATLVDIYMSSSTFTQEYTGNQTNTVVLTPTGGQKLCIRTIETLVNGNAGDVSLDFATSSKKVYRHYSTATNRFSSNTGHLVGAIDEALTLNAPSLGANKLWLVITYIEHD